MKIVILATSDVHSHIFPVNQGNNEEDPQGMAKAASIIKEIRHHQPYTIIVDNGDLIQGTPLADYVIHAEQNIPHPAITIHNLLQYDAAVIGNHEFNYGKEPLEQMIEQADFPWLSANVVKKGSDTPYFGKPYIIRTFEELRVAVLGLTTKFIPHWEVPKHIQAFDFIDPIPTAKKWIAYLKQKEQADVIIVAYHGGFEKNPNTHEPIGEETGENQGFRLLTEVKDIDCLITGHQHLTFASDLANGVSVIQPGSGASHIGKITITVTKKRGKWQVEEKHAALISVKEAKEDKEVIHAVQPIVNQANDWLEQKIGRIIGDMTIQDPMEQVWLKEHPLIEWMNKVQMKAANVDISCTALLHPNIKGLPETVSRKDLMNVYPFPNTLVVMKLTGKEIIQALEVAASFLLRTDGGKVIVNPDWMKPRLLSYNFDMWEGINYQINLKKPIGHRVQSVTYHGKPIALKTDYKVVMNSYRASGSGGYKMFSHKKVIDEIHREVAELLIEEVNNRKTIEAEVNDNWEIIY